MAAVVVPGLRVTREMDHPRIATDLGQTLARVRQERLVVVLDPFPEDLRLLVPPAVHLTDAAPRTALIASWSWTRR